MKDNRIIIAGGRDFCNDRLRPYHIELDYDLLFNKCDRFLKDLPSDGIEIVSGTARGADQAGEKYALERGYPIKIFPANWDLGKHAGHLRNEEMAKYASHLIAFWDGISKGTQNMILTAKNHNLKIRIVRY